LDCRSTCGWLRTVNQDSVSVSRLSLSCCSAHCKQDIARELFQKTRQQEEKIKNAGYNLVVVWECKAPGYKDITHEQKIVIYPHAIVYDFETYLDKAKIYSATKDLTLENVHVPISVYVGDTLNQQPTHLCERDPEVLIEKFMNELQSRAPQLRAAVKTQYLPVDVDMLQKKQQQKNPRLVYSGASTRVQLRKIRRDSD